jgi:hypothetical protein
MTRPRFFEHLMTTLSGSPTASGVSPRMADLIGRFKGLEAALVEIDDVEDPVRWNIAAELEMQALTRLLDQRPVNMAEFAAKFSALIYATGNDTDFRILRVLAAEARELVEGAQ